MRMPGFEGPWTPDGILAAVNNHLWPGGTQWVVDMLTGIALAWEAERASNKVRIALLLILDQVDYTTQACSPTEMVAAVLPVEIIKGAREALA